MKILLLFACFSALSIAVYAQGDNEIQVYSSPTVPNHSTIFELHSNYTPKGSKSLTDPKSAHYLNETLEITHGYGNNFEIGFYTFTNVTPRGEYQYLGNNIRPRVTVPEKWKWPFGASLSTEFGFFRPETHSKAIWQGEIRPIIDKTFGNMYVTFNPNLGFVLTGDNKQLDIAPQLKAVYTIKKAFGLGIEYYSSLGTFNKILPGLQQEHILGPMFDLYTSPNWELNTGVLFGLNANSNQEIFKLLVGRRIGK